MHTNPTSPSAGVAGPLLVGPARFPRFRMNVAIGCARLVTLLRLWRQRAYERHYLRMMDERVLSDIGLTRADAEYLASKPFWRG